MSTEVVLQQSEVPDFLSRGPGMGNENVGSSDITIPRIELVQAISPVRKKSDPAYIEGCEEGDLFNSLTRQLYGKSVLFIPVLYVKEYILWKDRAKGGGFRGVANTMAEARSLINEPDIEVAETPQQFVLIVHPNGTFEEAVISMPKSKNKASKRLNSLIKMIGSDRFAAVFELSSVEESGDKGDYHNYSVKQCRWVTKPEYDRAKQLYEILVAGGRKVDREVNEGTLEDSTQF
jgi:hypothetical protein